MRNKTFVILAFLILLIGVFAYPVAVDKIAIQDRIVAPFYPQFLLKASRPIHNRLIITSGSNSALSIDATLIEKYFGRFVIVLADNGSYPLEHKIYNLNNHVSAGDIILFPLELQYYTETEKLPGNYVKAIFNKIGSSSFYYRALPSYNKISFIYNHVPFVLALKRILIPNRIGLFNKQLRQNEAGSVNYFRDSIDKGRRGSNQIKDSKGLARDSSDTQICDVYILGGKISEAFKVSEQFRRNLALLQRMAEEKDVEIIFTWPAVTGKTGNECYTSVGVRENIGRYTQEIESEVKRHGFKFIGDIKDSRFESSCFLNTYYHINADCAITRTRRLIDLLEINGLTPDPSYSMEESKKVLNNSLRKMELAVLARKGKVRVNVPIETTDLTKKLLFSKGWSTQEKQGIWSLGKMSIIFVPKLDRGFDSIRFKGIYFNGNEKTGLWVNGEFVGSYVLADRIINLEDVIDPGEPTEIVLKHLNPVSAKELGIDMDERKIKFGLQSIEFIN